MSTANNPSSRPKKEFPLLCPDLVPVKEAHRNHYFKVMDRGGYFTLEYDVPQVVVLPVVEKKSVVMVKVFRPVINDTPWELPAGGCKQGESVQEAAARELAEETGIIISDISRMKPEKMLSEMPGRMPFLLPVFRIDLAMSEWVSRKPHDAEIHSVHLLKMHDICKLICNGTIYLSSPAAILSRFVLKEHLKGKKLWSH